jgi:uncharacterized protein
LGLAAGCAGAPRDATHRDGHEKPAPLVIGERYRVCPTQRCGLGLARRPQGKARLVNDLLADGLADCNTLLNLGGTLDLPVRPCEAADALLSPLPGPETAPPEKPTRLRRGEMLIERIDRIRLEFGTESKSYYHLEEDNPLSAVAELQRTQTMSRGPWKVRVET